MTGLLEDLLASKAAAVDPPAVDLDRVVADGNRRIRRRRGLVVAATAAVVAGAVAIAWGVIQIDRSAGPVGTPFREPRPTYSAGSTIHYGDTIVDVGHQIKAFVRTDAAFVFTTPSDEVFVADGKHVDKIGTTTGRLVADDSGPYVGWTDSGSYFIADTAARRASARVYGGPRTSGPTIVAIDDGYAYVVHADGLHRLGLSDNTDELVARGIRADSVLDVAAGRYAILGLPAPGGAFFMVNTEPTADGPSLSGLVADLSPDASLVVAYEGPGPRSDRQLRHIHWTGSRQEVTIRHPGYKLGTTAWIDDNTFTTWGVRTDRVDLLICSVSAGSCTSAETALQGSAGGDPGLRLPNGHDTFGPVG